MAQYADRYFDRYGVRLTPRAQVLLHLILDGLADEPIRWQKALGPEEENALRRHELERVIAALPDLLRGLAERSGKLHSEEPITLFDILHHFEATAHVMFFPGKLP